MINNPQGNIAIGVGPGTVYTEPVVPKIGPNALNSNAFIVSSGKFEHNSSSIRVASSGPWTMMPG